MSKIAIDTDDFDPDSMDLPEGWCAARLQDLVVNPRADIVDGPFGSNLKSDEYTNTGVPVIRIQNVHRNRFVTGGIKFVTHDKARELSRHSFVPGDIVITKLGDPLGRACLVPSSIQPGLIVADIVRVRISDSTLRSYVAACINGSLASSQLQSATKGSTRPRVNLSHIRNLRLPLPPLAEQRRIVAKVEDLLAQVNAARARLIKLPALLKRFRQSVLAAACSGRLTEEWRDHHRGETGTEFRTVLLETRRNGHAAQVSIRRRYIEPVEPELADDLPALPETWVWASPHQVAAGHNNSLTIGPFGSNLKVADYCDAGVPLVFVRNIRSGNFADTRFISQEKAAELVASAVRGGDIVVTKMGEPPGDAAVYPRGRPDAVVTADCIKLTASTLIPESRFLVYAIHSDATRRQVQRIAMGVAQQKVSLERFKTLALPLPPREEQSEIVRRVDVLFKLADTIDQRVAAATGRVDNLTQSILAKAFRGELVPTEADLAQKEGRKFETAAEMLAGASERSESAAQPKRRRSRRSA